MMDFLHSPIPREPNSQTCQAVGSWELLDSPLVVVGAGELLAHHVGGSGGKSATDITHTSESWDKRSGIFTSTHIIPETSALNGE